MSVNNSFPICIEPCLRKRYSSESVWLQPSDFGECYQESSPDLSCYPCLTLLFNGEVLNVQQDLIHASLSGISIKHYYGKCEKEKEEEEEEEVKSDYGNAEEQSDDDNYFYGERIPLLKDDISKDGEQNKEKESPNIDSNSSDYSEIFQYRENTPSYLNLVKPACMQKKLNFRNSFWNLQKPELCKLTWPQGYVSAATVTEYLHDHLTSHETICQGFHDKKDLRNMLNKELDEYGRLKMLTSPRTIPPDEKFFNFKMNGSPTINPKCKGYAIEREHLYGQTERCLDLSDDEFEDKNVLRRSKEEFCLTIGRHIRKPPILEDVVSVEEETYKQSYVPEEEELGLGYFNWAQYYGEESLPENDNDESTFDSEVDLMIFERDQTQRHNLAMDEFCRAAGKVDFSDLRCNPDDF